MQVNVKAEKMKHVPFDWKLFIQYVIFSEF